MEPVPRPLPSEIRDYSRKRNTGQIISAVGIIGAFAGCMIILNSFKELNEKTDVKAYRNANQTLSFLENEIASNNKNSPSERLDLLNKLKDSYMSEKKSLQDTQDVQEFFRARESDEKKMLGVILGGLAVSLYGANKMRVAKKKYLEYVQLIE